MKNEKLLEGTQVYRWKSDPPLTPFAPSYEYYIIEKKIFSEGECREWNDYLLEQEKILLNKFTTSSGHGKTGLGDCSITARWAHFNLLKFDSHLVEQLKTEIFDGIKYILSVSGNTTWQETLYANSWFNVMRGGEAMNVHSHGYHKNIFCGFHLCINAIETFTSYYFPVVDTKHAPFHIPNKIGYLTLFPDFIPHGVSPNRYETPRISIAGDTYPSTWISDPAASPGLKDLTVEIGTYNNDL